MRAQQFHFFLGVGTLAVGGCLFIAFAPPFGAGQLEPIRRSALWGAMIAQVTLSAIWAAFGPLKIKARLPLAFGWLVLVLAAVGYSLKGMSTSHYDKSWMVIEIEIRFVMIVLLGGLWALLQVVFWTSIKFTGIQLREDVPVTPVQGYLLDKPQRSRNWKQVSIRDLLLLTFVVAVIIGTRRFFITHLLSEWWREDWVIALTIIFSSTSLLLIPWFIASLLTKHRYAWLAGSLLLMGVATTVEEHFLANFTGGRDFAWFPSRYWINAFAALWVFTFSLFIQGAGYRLRRIKTSRVA